MSLSRGQAGVATGNGFQVSFCASDRIQRFKAACRNDRPSSMDVCSGVVALAHDGSCESTRILSIRTHFLRIRTRTEILSIPLTRELAWFPPRKGRFGPKAFRRHRALRGAGFPAPG